jgi:hypothetical protein
MRILPLFLALIVLLLYPVVSSAKEPGCMHGESRQCGSNQGVCIAGISSCIQGRWSECIGAKGPASELDICGNGIDDNCNGVVDEGCSDYRERCNDGRADWDEQGMDCGGSCPEKCSDIPWLWFIMIGLGLFVFAMVLYYRQRSSGIITGGGIGRD